VIMSNVLLLTLLGAMLTSVAYLQHKDSLGLTFLERGKDIVELESMCGINRRIHIYEQLGFENRIEFDEGDLGVSGGIQVYESATRNVHGLAADDRILRFPGEASSKIPWPVNTNTNKTLTEKLINLESTYARIAKSVRDMIKLEGVKGKAGGVNKGSELSAGSQSRDEHSTNQVESMNSDDE